MKRWPRRHARLIAASLAVVLAGTLAVVLHSSGPAHALGAAEAAQVHAIAPVLAPAAQRRRARQSPTSRPRLASVRRRPIAAAAQASALRAGAPAPAASRRSESRALQQVAGLSLDQVASRPVCARASAGHAACAAQVLVLRSSGAPVRPRVAKFRSLGRVRAAAAQGASPPPISPSGGPTPNTPGYLEQAYDLAYLSQSGGAGDTVAVVDAYNDPSAESDLANYRSWFGLGACTTDNGCFRKVGQTGTSTLPAANSNWEQEIALDLDAVSAVCPNCHILLVEANTNSFSDLESAMQTAANLGAKQISASWGGVSSGVPSVFRTFSGVATVAATGDTGYVGAGVDNYPAALPGVTAAGGTSLAAATAPNARGFGESAWSWNGLNGGASGCDLQFERPDYQPAMGCNGRAYADVSADADPTTGLDVYDHGSWTLIGGTSLSTPLIAAYYAVTGVAGATPQWAYGASSALNDVVSGYSGNCGATIAYICNAGPGYDGPTGVGSISGSVVTGAPGIGGPFTASGTANTYTSAVSAHGATIAGGIYRNGLDTTWSIQYGTSTAYGNQTPASDIGAGSAPVSVTGYLSQLSPNTTYHYRLVAHNSAGTIVGYDYTLTTPSGPSGTPTALFTASPSTPAPGAPVSFDGLASTPASGGSISDYTWNFGDGKVQDGGTQATANHAYAQRGTYTVTLSVTSNGQTDTSTHTITVDTPPTAAVTPLATAVPTGTTVAFNAGASTASSGGSITDYSWNFGDGTAAQDGGAGTTASHTFTTPGTYTVTITATDDLDVMSTSTTVVTVAPFTVSPANPTPGASATFAAVGSAPAGTTYAWDFGDQGQPGSGASVTHAYSARGAYNVTLTIQSGTTSTTSSAVVDVDSAPTPVFTQSASAVLPGTTVSFDGSTSTPAPGGSIADYGWNFGDGTSVLDGGTTATTSHTFTTPGTYEVTLTTTDDLGASAPTTRTVIVDQPAPSFTFSPAGPAPNATVSFDATGTTDAESAIADYSWTFGDNTQPVDAHANPVTSHTYSAAGTYIATLTVTDQLGLSATISEQVVVVAASAQSTGTSTPPTTSTPTPTPVPPSPAPPAPVTSPTPTPPGSTPISSSPAPIPTPTAFAVMLTGARRQRLAPALAHGLRLALALSAGTVANFQVTVPLAETKPTAQSAKLNRKATVVLLRSTQTLGAGSHTIVFKLSRAAAGRLATRGALVLSVKVTASRPGGGTVTRTLKITLVR